MLNKSRLLWLALGLGIRLQVVASLSVSECIVLFFTPFLLPSEYNKMRRNGVLPFFFISILTMLGCGFSCLYNHTPGYFFIRGMAVTVLLPCSIVVSHYMLTKHMEGYRWFFVGVAISMTLCIFVFQNAVETMMLAGGETGGYATQRIISGPVFWIGRLKPYVMAPINGWYLAIPRCYLIFAPLGFALFSILTTASGRSSALGALGGVALIIIGGKKIKSMRRISKHFVTFCIVGIILIFVLHAAYKTAASSGLLGEKQQEKYEVQTKGRGDIVSLLMGGRLGSIVGFIACFDNPIIGFGAMPLDTKGYYEEFLGKYGDPEDYDAYYQNKLYEAREGLVKIHMIPCHTAVGTFWVEFGIFGLIFWLYVFYALCRYVRYDVVAVPQWYGWLVFSIPAFLWDAFFSPFAGRVQVPLMIVACLVARAVRRGRVRLPRSMVMEIVKSESK